uniref:unspecific monooxygenase n=1 Tax=Gasterosteus aculeatus aculeatus TaxID=481459 RepID=A0AAQ4S9R8_GASAC
MGCLPFFSVETWILLITFICIFVIYGNWTHGIFENLGIPGPKPYTYWGTIGRHNKVCTYFEIIFITKYGKVWGMYEFRSPMLAVMDPDMLKTILVKQCFTYFTNRRNIRLNGDLYDSVSTVEDDHWRRIRNVLTPSFTSGHIKEMFKIMKHLSSKLTASLTDHEILTQATMFMVAGYETSATTLAFLAYNLARNPEVMKRLQEEIDSTFPNKGAVRYEELLQMEYLDSVVNESMRLYPPAGRLDRVAKKTVEIRGITIPKDMIVMIPVYALHRDPDLWPEPEEFKPDRFSKQNKRSINPYTYLPFGTGPRNCLGMRFALVLVKLALVEVLQNYSFSVCGETEIPLTMDPGGLVGPLNPIKLKVTTR